MRVAQPIVLTDDQRQMLEQESRGRLTAARVVERARIVLLAAKGLQNKDIAKQMKITPEKVARWRRRYLEGGWEILVHDAPRSGRPRTIPATKTAKVVKMTTEGKPDNATQWSTRTMAAAVGMSESTVRRIWHAHGLKPHLSRPSK